MHILYSTILNQKPSHHNFKRSKNKYICTYIHKRSALDKSWWGKKKKGKGNRCGKMIQTMKLSVFKKTYRMRKVFS